ncbi:MAG: hypothetical protein GXO86_12630 [Chlorobi bacterium]|nr:hypothetical protein [Chlorobiota bacterium]
MDKFYLKENNGWSGPFVESEFEVKIAGMDDVTYWKPEFCPNHILHPALCSHFKTMAKGEEKTTEEPEVQEVASLQEQTKEPPESPVMKKTAMQEKPETLPKEEVKEAPAEPALDIPSGENGKKTALKPEPEITVDDSVSPSKPEKKEEEPAPEKETKPEPEHKLKKKDNQTAEKSVKKEESTKEPTQMSSKSGPEPTQEKPVKAKPSEVKPKAGLPETPATPRTGGDDQQGYLLKLAVIVIGFLLVIMAGFYVNSRLSVVKYQDTIIRNYIEQMDDRTKDIFKEQQALQKKMDSLKLLLGRELKALKGIETGLPAGRDKRGN